MKKIILTILATLCLLCLAACGGEADYVPMQPATQPTTETPSDPTTEPTT